MANFNTTGAPVSKEVDEQLADFAGQFTFDFPGLVDAMFPWGSPPFDMPPYDKPKKWRYEVLRQVSDHRRENHFRRLLGLDPVPFRLAIASGHGVGKSTLVAWLILCFMVTVPDVRGVVTANTAAQLETKTWPELGKWNGHSIFKHWFNWTATNLVYAPYPEDRRKNYMFNAATVSEENSEAFAGLHNVGSCAVVIFDEASGIPPILYEIADGVAAQSGTEFFFFAFGNPTRPDGPFFDCFYLHSKLFQVLLNLDNRDVEGTNLIAQEQIIEKYGAESDEVKVRVKGQFPSKSMDGFISESVIAAAQRREVFADPSAPIIIGCDVARFGGDETCIRVRQGRNARTVHEPIKIPYGRSTEVTRRLKELCDKLDADAIVIEGLDAGTGVIDQLAEAGYPVFEIHPNQRAEMHKRFGNLRAEMWAAFRDWLAGKGCIDSDPDLAGDLKNMRYRVETGEGQARGLLMEPKAKMRDRGLPSPDDGDSLALTFAVQINRRDERGNRRVGGSQAISAEPQL